MPILTDQERLGTTIGDGRYRLESLLGRGGMGTVFEAVHEWTGRRVAVKLLRHDLASDIEASQRFLGEARSATAIDHPNVVEVLDMGRHDEWTVYMVLELLRGKSLADRIDAVGRLEPMEAAMILLPVSDAVAAAHRLGIIHRDLKPDNIFLEDDGMGYIRPKLLDFGIARAAEREFGKVTTGVIAGTPEYLSPEHAQGFRAGPASDVWSLGIVLFECITGTLPFKGESVLNVLLAIISNPIPSLRDKPEVPALIADVVERALVRDAAARIPDADTFRDALAAAAELQFQPSRSRSVASKILCDSGEIALSADHQVEIRQSTPRLGSITPVRVPLSVPERLSAAPPQPFGTLGLPEAEASAAARRTPTPGQDPGPPAVATLAETPRVALRPLAVVEESEPTRSRSPGLLALLAVLVVGVVVFFGYRATRPEHTQVTGPGPTGRDSRPTATAPSPPPIAESQLTYPPEVASAVIPPEGPPPQPASSSAAQATEAESGASTRGRSPRAESSETATSPAPEQGPAAPGAAPPTVDAGSNIQRGANGSLILD